MSMTTHTHMNSRLVANNTLMLYIRMLLIMFVTIYTSRVLLETLGVDNFGIYNVVGGTVTMLGFLNASMANAVQRFLAFEIGRGDHEKVNKVFCIAIIGHIVIIIIVFILAEFIGVWLVNYELTIPKDRLFAANWVLQSSIIIMLISFIQVPYNAIILAYEQMNIYAYITIIEAFLRLGIVFIVLWINYDKLVVYAILQAVISILIFLTYKRYCNKRIISSKWRYVKDNKTLKAITSFVGYNLIGEIGMICTGQGLSIVLNIFCGPVVNAARGLAEQVNSAVSRFSFNFQQALVPQIIKTYANNELQNTFSLLFRGIKFSYYLMWLLSLPLLLETKYVLEIWLIDVPDYTVSFCRIILIASMIGVMSGLLSQVVRANGNIKNYQIVCSVSTILSLPIAYILMKLGYSPIVALSTLIFAQIGLFFARLWMTSNLTGMSKMLFFNKTTLPIIGVTLVSLPIPLVINTFVNNGFVQFALSVLVSCVSVLTAILIIGTTKTERSFIMSYCSRFLKLRNGKTE